MNRAQGQCHSVLYCFHFHFDEIFPFVTDCKGSNLFMGYIGDSRAILASKDINDSMVATQLTVDLKPDLPSMSYSNFLVRKFMAMSFPC